MVVRKRRLGEILIDSGAINQKQLEHALNEQKSSGKRLGETLVTLGYLTEKQILSTLEQQLGIKYVNLSEEKIEREAIAAVPLFLAERYNVVPVRKEDTRLYLAMSDPTNFYAIDDVRMVSGLEVWPLLAEAKDISLAINNNYGVQGRVESAVSKLKEDDAGKTSVQDVEDKIDNAPIISIVNSLIQQAVRDRASDIHIEPQEDNLRVRFRVDGVMREIISFPKNTHAPILSRIKIMGDMDIAEKRLPQDGRINIQEKGRQIDIRVSTLPTILGEKVVMRILDKSAMTIALDELGFSERNFELYKDMITKSYGCVLVTGPTGSGKSTTLYSTLMHVNAPTKNIITVEDPVEYRIGGVNQVAVNNKAGLTFASGLRTILRQDPNIIMVGEVRDKETAEITINAALTGHLVFSTLHTNDSAGAITRLLDMGVEPFLVVSSVRGVIAQRLVRLICPHCKMEYTPEPYSDERLYLGIGRDEPVKLWKGEGCSRCNFTGYTGRMAIHEVLPIHEEMKAMIMNHVADNLVFEAGRKYGTTSMKEDGIEKVMQGKTTVSELLRVAYV
ncbi:MAG: Flp pilus assembly complex ATPase component TadA [Acholeplasmataceae bacterium]|nr:ATPase, T2SS/T4P/T4SS family [Acidaminococcaceae bacterium]NLY84529.1 Flp pilus assembly complex ATPase component TadA [Acholeplasmataceae bacterium]